MATLYKKVRKLKSYCAQAVEVKDEEVVVKKKAAPKKAAKKSGGKKAQKV